MDPATTQAVAKAVEESAKTAGKGFDIVHDTAGYLSSVVGDLPANAVGLLGADWLRERRIRNLDALRRRTAEILRERDVKEAIELSPNQATELLTAAQDEGQEELAELWARLLANAMDPNLNNVRHSFIEAVTKMDRVDAIVLQYIHDTKIAAVRLGRAPEPLQNSTSGVENIAIAVQRRNDDVEVSFRHLRDLLFFDSREVSGHDFWVNVTCREFLRACYPEVTPK